MILLDILQSLHINTTEFRVLVSIIAIIVSIIVFNRTNKTKLNRFVSEKVKYIAAGIFISGIIIYSIGFWDEGSKGNLIALFFRATLSSLEMFVSHSDLIEVRHSMHENALYMLCFAIIHFAAVLLSAILIIPLLAYLWHSQKTLKKISAKKLFIFWGESTNSFLMAEDIVRTQTNGEYKILFIETPSDKKSSDSSIHFTHLFSGSLVKNEKMEHITALKALLLTSKVSTLKRDERSGLEALLADAGLSSVYQSIAHNPIEEIKIFLLSEDFEENLKNATALLSTTEPKDSPIMDKKIEVFCNCTYNDLTIMYTYGSMYKRSNGDNNITLTIADAARLAVAQLRDNPAHHPVNFVDIDTDTATAQTPFTALVAGFDDTGHEAMKFLYEFGSMLGSDGKKNPLKIYVSSSAMKRTPSHFYMQHPALRGNSEVELVPGDSGSPEFWESMEAVINDLNYVVVCTGNDLENLQFAVNTLRIACRKRKNGLRHFKIFIRSYTVRYQSALQDLCSYYRSANPDWGDLITVFGRQEDIFTYKSIVEQEAVIQSVSFYERFAKATGSEDWMTRFMRLSRTYAQHLEFAYKITQDMSNYWHIGTKARLAGITNDDNQVQDASRLNALLQVSATRPDMTEYHNELKQSPSTENRARIVDRYCNYTGNEPYVTILRNLAATEHLRWAALMEMMGYTADNGTANDVSADTVARRHPCVVGLDEILSTPSLRETLPYDHSVVDISLQMMNKQSIED